MAGKFPMAGISPIKNNWVVDSQQSISTWVPTCQRCFRNVLPWQQAGFNPWISFQSRPWIHKQLTTTGGARPAFTLEAEIYITAWFIPGSEEQLERCSHTVKLGNITLWSTFPRNLRVVDRKTNQHTARILRVIVSALPQLVATN